MFLQIPDEVLRVSMQRMRLAFSLDSGYKSNLNLNWNVLDLRIDERFTNSPFFVCNRNQKPVLTFHLPPGSDLDARENIKH